MVLINLYVCCSQNLPQSTPIEEVEEKTRQKMNFNVHKWNKQRYLAEAGIYETATLDLAKEINKILPESLGYKDLLKL
jgi:hypothetical protein